MSKKVEAILNFEGATPRVVGDLQNLDFDIEYMRDDVDSLYTNGDLDEAYRIIMGNLASGDEFKSLVGKPGFKAQTWFFDELLVCIFPSERYQAVFASFDYDEDFPVNQLVKRVSDATSTE